MDLSGVWRGARRSPELERAGADPDLDDSGWETLAVPGHWGQHPAFGTEAGPVWYRRRFTAPAPEPDQRAWLRFDGVLAEAEVWLDGQPLGDTGAYFTGHRFEITRFLTDRSDGPATAAPEGPTAAATEGPIDDPDAAPADDEPAAGPAAQAEHLLAVEVACDGDRNGSRRSFTGALQTGSLAPPGSPGGIWRPVGIDTTGPIAILRARLLCLAATEAEATLQFRVELDVAAAGPIRIDTSIAGPDGSTAGGVAHHEVASGENHLEWTATIPRPQLWWPAALGDQPRYDVAIAVRQADGRLSDRRHWRTGLRTVEVEDFIWTVNGRRLFAKGIAVGPHDRFLAQVDPAQMARDVRTVRDTGLDLIRVQGHVARPQLYDAADDLGLLVWQDLPLVGTYATRSRAAARALARAAVDELGHHPSVAVWCAHDEPNGPPLPQPGSMLEPVTRVTRRLGRHVAPSWNRTVLDPLLRRELRSADPTRAALTHSGNLPGPLDLNGSDTHLWLGWHTGRAEDLPELLRRWPRLGRFVSTIGAQSVSIDDWPPDAPRFASAERGAFDRYVPRGAYADGESWAQATQAYQADVIRSQVETLRRLKYAPAGGFCVTALFDAEDDGGFGLLDRSRNAKPALDHLAEACRPVIVVADAPPAIVTPEQHLSLALHAVSDLRHELGPVRVSARARLDDWELRRHWTGRLPADSCSYIGTLELRVPPRTGALTIDIELEADGHLVSNHYRTVVIPPSESMTPLRA